MSVTTYEVGRSPGPPARARVAVDPITLRVLGGAFHAIAKEMAGVLFRMSYSSIIRESEDLGAGLFDAEGRELCESDSTPMHIGSLPWYIRGFLDRLDGELEEGDVIVHNHPYLGASHSPDVAVAVPMFHDVEHVRGHQRGRLRRVRGGQALQRPELVSPRRNQHRRRSDDLRQRPHGDDEPRRHERCLLYTSPSPRDRQKSRMPSSA